MRSEMISTKKVINYKVADVFDLYNIAIKFVFIWFPDAARNVKHL